MRPYWALFKAHLDDALVERIPEATNGNHALGDRRFQAEIEQALGRRVTQGKAGRPKAQPEHRRGQLGLLWNRVVCPLLLPGPSVLFFLTKKGVYFLFFLYP
jgi:hypothetical protein